MVIDNDKKIFFQLSDDPNLERLEAWELERYFHSTNPFWVEEGEPLELENFLMAALIRCLKGERGLILSGREAFRR